jgi:hypothetical protein
MEEIKDLKIETVAHIFPKFMRMHWIMHAFLFCANRRGTGGAPDSLVGRAELNQFAGVVDLSFL